MCFFRWIGPTLSVLAWSCLAVLAQSTAADLYVSPKGKDSWSGKLAAPNAAGTDGPFASAARAQAGIRELRKADPNRNYSVMLRGGTYYLPLSPTSPGTLKFTVADSGTTAHPITWQNYPGETPVISGGEPVGKDGLNLTWKHLSGALWQVQLPADTQPFEYFFYNGERRLRPRVQSPSGVGYFMRGGACYSTESKKTVDNSLCNLGTFLRIAAEVPAQGPNAGCPAVANIAHPSTAKCLDRFVYDANDPIASWINLNPNDTACPQAAPDSPSSKYPVGDVELTLFNAWTVDVMRISCVDPGKHMIYLSAGTKADSVNYESFGPVAGHRYIIENVKDAFDAAAAAGQTGLWFLDRSTSPWTLNYLARRGENPNSDNLVIAQVGPIGPIGASLLTGLYVDCVVFKGITFEVDNFIPPAEGFSKDEISGDMLPQAIDCISCENAEFDGITVRHTSASGILLASGSGDIDRPPMNNKVLTSAFYDIGASGIRIGKHPLSSDRSNHVISIATVENNIVQGFSRVFASGNGIAQANGHDIAYVHNDVNDGYHTGINVCLIGCPVPAANTFNITVLHNHIWNVGQGITSNGPGVYFSTGIPAGSGANNKIESNLIHDVVDSSVIDSGVAGYGFGGDGIFLDNNSANIDIDDNVVFRVTDSAVAIREGPPKGYNGNRIHNNILASAGKSMFRFTSPWSPAGCMEDRPRVSLTKNIMYFERDAAVGFQVTRGCTYSCNLDFDKFQNFQGNLYWRNGGGFANDTKAFSMMTKTPRDPVKCNGAADAADFKFLNFAQWQAMKEDANGTASVDPHFGKSNTPKDYLLSKSPVAGFDFSKTNETIQTAGRSHPVIMPPKVPPTFPTFAMKD